SPVSLVNSWERNPLLQGPDVIGPPGGPGRCASDPTARVPRHAQRSHRPAEVVAEGHERTHGLMHFPVLGERVRLPHLAAIPFPLSPVNAPAARRPPPLRPPPPVPPPRPPRRAPAPPPLLRHGRIVPPRRHDRIRRRGAARPSRPLGDDFLPVDLPEGGGVGR